MIIIIIGKMVPDSDRLHSKHQMVNKIKGEMQGEMQHIQFRGFSQQGHFPIDSN